MADRSIGQLPEVTAMGVTDLFVFEQAGAAKKLTGQLLKATLTAWLDGHGGIQSWSYDADTGKVTVTATDSRGYSTSQTIEKTLVPYVQLTCNILRANRPVPSSNEAQIEVSGQ